MNTADAHNCADHAKMVEHTIWENGQKIKVAVLVCSICGAQIIGPPVTVR